MSERRYSEPEVEAIFRTASDDRRVVERQTSRDDGLTVADLQWTNGNLRVLLEPTSAGGHRLRSGSYNGAVQAWITAGLASLGAMVLALVVGGGWAGACHAEHGDLRRCRRRTEGAG